MIDRILEHLVPIFGLAAACAAWVLLQRWIAGRHPDLPGVERGCGSCGGGGSCGHGERECARDAER